MLGFAQRDSVPGVVGGGCIPGKGLSAWVSSRTRRDWQLVALRGCVACDPWLVFEGFTERARQVVVYAQEEVRGLGHDHIGTEHILLGLVREYDGVASRILLDLDVEPERIRNEAIRMSGGHRGQPG